MPLYSSRGFSASTSATRRSSTATRFTLEGRRSARACARRCGGSGGRYRFQLIAESNAPPTLVRAAQRDQRAVAGQEPRTRLHDVAVSQDIRGDGANPEFLLCVALDEDNAPGGFLRLVPAYGPSFGYTLDLMRHDPDAPNGMTEFLIASTAAALGDAGRGSAVDELRDVGPAVRRRRPVHPRAAGGDAGPSGCSTRSSRSSRCTTSTRSSTPSGCPRVLAYRRRADLPRVALLYAGAEGFLAASRCRGAARAQGRSAVSRRHRSRRLSSERAADTSRSAATSDTGAGRGRDGRVGSSGHGAVVALDAPRGARCRAVGRARAIALRSARSFRRPSAAFDRLPACRCARAADAAGRRWRNQALRSRTYALAVRCPVDTGASRRSTVRRRDRTATPRPGGFEALLRPRGSGVVYTLGDMTIFVLGSGDDDVQERARPRAAARRVPGDGLGDGRRPGGQAGRALAGDDQRRGDRERAEPAGDGRVRLVDAAAVRCCPSWCS